jgi:ATP-dependent Clp protease protease subunit
MIHQPSGGSQGQATDISIQAKEILRIKQKLVELYAKHTGQSEDKLNADLERDFFLTAEEAKAYGLVDEVASPLPRFERQAA